jgi:hypothetical protein
LSMVWRPLPGQSHSIEFGEIVSISICRSPNWLEGGGRDVGSPRLLLPDSGDAFWVPVPTIRRSSLVARWFNSSVSEVSWSNVRWASISLGKDGSCQLVYRVPSACLGFYSRLLF